MKCLPPEAQMEQIPEHDWFCPTCQEKSIWQAEELRGKKKITKDRRSLVHYLVHWTGYTTDDDTWEPLSNLVSKGAKKLVSLWNAKEREAAAAAFVAAPAPAARQRA